MGAVQANGGQKYEQTRDPKRMLTHKLLNEAIRNDWENIRGFLPARTATSIRYEKGARRAVAWNESEAEVSIDLPLKDGWYLSDGNPFAIPNGRESDPSNPDALHLWRYQDRSYSGPVGRGVFFGFGRRNVYAVDYWSNASGVAIIGRSAARLDAVQGAHGPEAHSAAPLANLPRERQFDITDPRALLQRAQQLETAAKGLIERLGTALSADAHTQLIKPILDEAAFLRELAEKATPKA